MGCIRTYLICQLGLSLWISFLSNNCPKLFATYYVKVPMNKHELLATQYHCMRFILTPLTCAPLQSVLQPLGLSVLHPVQWLLVPAGSVNAEWQEPRWYCMPPVWEPGTGWEQCLQLQGSASWTSGDTCKRTGWWKFNYKNYQAWAPHPGEVRVANEWVSKA